MMRSRTSQFCKLEMVELVDATLELLVEVFRKMNGHLPFLIHSDSSFCYLGVDFTVNLPVVCKPPKEPWDQFNPNRTCLGPAYVTTMTPQINRSNKHRSGYTSPRQVVFGNGS